jgi:hypothetical protein
MKDEATAASTEEELLAMRRQAICPRNLRHTGATDWEKRQG